MKVTHILLGLLVLLSACSQAPVLHGEHYPYYDECTLVQEYGLYQELDCTQYALQAYQDQSHVLPEICEIQGNNCESFETEVGFTELFLRIQTQQSMSSATVTYSSLTRECRISENTITCSVPFVAMDRDHKQAFTLQLDGEEALVLAYV